MCFFFLFGENPWVCYVGLAVDSVTFFFFFFFKFEGVPNFVIEGVPNTEEIKKNTGFFSGQDVPRNTLSCKWCRH